jgi:hypothetical protein
MIPEPRSGAEQGLHSLMMLLNLKMKDKIMSIASYFKERKIERLKKKLRDLYLDYHDYLMAFDCGAALAQYVCSNTSKIEREFNKTYAKLKALDPKCPDFKLKKE